MGSESMSYEVVGASTKGICIARFPYIFKGSPKTFRECLQFKSDFE
jgi:hypothetical protein